MQMDLLTTCVVGGGILFAASGWRMRGVRRLLPILTGFGVLLAGIYLAFLYWVPNPGNGAECGSDCGFVTPYGLPGIAVASWGLSALLFGMILVWIEGRLASASVRGGAHGRPG
jgi:hypothetical protein